MLSPEPSLSAPVPYIFNTDEGRALCRQLISKQLGYEPHSYQLDGVVRSLDKVDILAVTPTGSGKTGFLTMYLLVMHAIMKNPSLLPPNHRQPEHFRKDAGMVVVCPTKSLESNMEPKFHSAGLSTLVINQDTANAATLRGENIWKQAPNVHVLIIAPEQLSSKGFERLLANRDFQGRVVAIGVDEVHLLNTWGQTFREAFKQIAPAQKRFDYNPILILLTATLRTGVAFNSVCAFMGLLPGHFHLIRRSNARYDIRFIFRTVQSSSYAFRFPELDWVLQEKRKVIVFCPTIRVGFRVAVYLLEQKKAVVTVDEQIRMYNSLNWDSYNSETLRLMQTNPCPRVTIATDTLSVGIDIENIQDVVLYDFTLPANTDDILQKAGRIRDGRKGASRAIIYLPRSAMETAQAVCKSIG
ncbi:P-loop containing nucleoside triphosphate hydrolase protein, partial [Ganoderma leucocontextum]